MEAFHFVGGDHEVQIAPGDPAACCIGHNDGIPAGAVGGGEEDCALAGEVFLAGNVDFGELERQDEAGHNLVGQAGDPRADAGAGCGSGGCGKGGAGGGADEGGQ